MRLSLPVAALGVAALLVMLWTCERPGRKALPGEPAAVGVRPQQGVPAQAGRPVDPAPDRQAQATSTALWDAADVVQRYLALLGGGDVAAAQALWSPQRSPRAHEEAGLRGMAPIRALRSQTGAARVLDDPAAPANVEIPVTVRATTATGERLEFAGWYRLRRNAISGRWEITAASINPRLR